MKIKRLEISGFKSFCDRTVLQFNQPITSVVGPNGCGKSNIVDAIRWCMGEQSAKHLRGGKMDDVIFAGSDSRGPLGMCEVTLVFENDGRVPVEYMAYAEIAVTRKLYRDGTSEYYLNKTPCRLRDITDFFLGTGIGAKAYSIIEQGRVGMIVSARAEDRRALIEEAAGITKYKAKKKAAEKKMEATRQNLLRVSDVVVEIEKQLGSLKRQAQKAERYRLYKNELKDLDLWHASHRWLHLSSDARRLAMHQADLAAERDDLRTGLAVKETAISTTRLEVGEKEAQLAQVQEALYELDNRIRLTEAEAEHESKESLSLREQSIEYAAEVELLTLQIADAQAEISVLTTQLTDAETLLSTQDSLLTDRDGDVVRIKEELAQIQRNVEEHRLQLSSAKSQVAGAEANGNAAQRRREDLQARLLRLEEESQTASSRLDELRRGSGKAESELAQLKQLKLDLTDERARAEERLAELAGKLAAGEQPLEELTRELQKHQARRASLEELLAKYEGFATGTRLVMQENQPRWGIEGLLADVVEPPEGFEPALEALLADRLGAILVQSQDAGMDAIEYLKSRNEGRASFIPLNRFSEAVPTDTQPVPEGARGRLLELVKFSSDFQHIANHLFADVIVVDDLLTGLDLWRAESGRPRRTYVTMEGEVIDPQGVVTGGARDAQGAGVLEKKREIRALEQQIESEELAHMTAAAHQALLEKESAALSTSLEELKKNAHEGEMQILTLEKDLARVREESHRLEDRLQSLGNDRIELQGQRDAAYDEAQGAQAQVSSLGDQIVTYEDSLSSLGHASLGVYERLESAQGLQTSAKVEVAQAQEKNRSLGDTMARIQRGLDDSMQRKERLERSILEGGSRSADLDASVGDRRETLTTLLSERSNKSDILTEVRIVLEANKLELLELENTVRTVRIAAESANDEVARLELRIQETQQTLLHLDETIADRYRLVLGVQVADFHMRAVQGEIEAERIKELRSLIERMGEINLNAIEEFNELDQRFTFLTGQKADLENALSQLEEAIDRINKTSKARFREVFDAVNTKFQEIFPRCFRGGHGRLVLTDEENILESGIEIIAQPPGKKNTTVDVLSGGEKAMTATALIFSIFLIKPSPFCLLDEVDAPLDDANVGRFNDLIRAMSDRSQFIVITHNKRTMQIADTLYGVTMEEPGISKIVSVNLSKLEKAPSGSDSVKATVAA